MIRPRKAERLIKSVGGVQRAKRILSNTPDNTATFYSYKHGLYLRKMMSPFGLVLEAYLRAGGWLIITNLNESALIKLSELRRAVVLNEQNCRLSIAANDCTEEVFGKSAAVVSKFGIGDSVVFACLSRSPITHRVNGVLKSADGNVQYLVGLTTDGQMTVAESELRKATRQERLTMRRVSSLDEAMTTAELDQLEQLSTHKGEQHA